MGDMEGEVGLGAGLNEMKKTAFVKAPETFWRWIEEGLSESPVHPGTFCNVSGGISLVTRHTRWRRMEKIFCLKTATFHSLKHQYLSAGRLREIY